MYFLKNDKLWHMRWYKSRFITHTAVLNKVPDNRLSYFEGAKSHFPVFSSYRQTGFEGTADGRFAHMKCTTQSAGAAQSEQQCLTGNAVFVVSNTKAGRPSTSWTKLVSHHALQRCRCGARKSPATTGRDRPSSGQWKSLSWKAFSSNVMQKSWGLEKVVNPNVVFTKLF